MNEKKPVSKNMDEIFIDGGLTNMIKKGRFTEKFSYSVTICVYLITACDTYACRKSDTNL